MTMSRSDMKFIDYIPLAVRTESPRKFDGFNSRLVHAALGVLTESVELRKHADVINLKEELGDVCWYVAISMDELGLNNADGIKAIGLEAELATMNPPSEFLMMHAIFASSDLVDMAKKHMFYNRTLNHGDFIENLSTIIEAIRLICNAHGILLSDVLESNIRKLRTRYPEKFTDEKAIVRNLAAESAALK
jgi:NTP pyrophosphatase (non-canonical NTP hydrolase)